MLRDSTSNSHQTADFDAVWNVSWKVFLVASRDIGHRFSLSKPTSRVRNRGNHVCVPFPRTTSFFQASGRLSLHGCSSDTLTTSLHTFGDSPFSQIRCDSSVHIHDLVGGRILFPSVKHDLVIGSWCSYGIATIPLHSCQAQRGFLVLLTGSAFFS